MTAPARAGTDATVVWSDSPFVFGRRWESGAWTDTETLGPGDDVRVDFNAAGEGVATWRDYVADATMARRWVPGLSLAGVPAALT